jgi:hypothetical protein
MREEEQIVDPGGRQKRRENHPRRIGDSVLTIGIERLTGKAVGIPERKVAGLKRAVDENLPRVERIGLIEV